PIGRDRALRCGCTARSLVQQPRPRWPRQTSLYAFSIISFQFPSFILCAVVRSHASPQSTLLRFAGHNPIRLLVLMAEIFVGHLFNSSDLCLGFAGCEYEDFCSIGLPAILRSPDVAMAGTANWNAVALQLATMDRHSERHVALLRRGCATLRATIDLQIVVGQSRNHFILLFSRQSHFTSASGTWRH